MFTSCHFAILLLKEHKFSDILIYIGRLFHILFPRNLIDIIGKTLLSRWTFNDFATFNLA